MIRIGRVALAAGLLFAITVGASSRARLPIEACRFIRYYEASARSEAPLKWWERVTYSLMLASGDSRS